MPNTTPAALLIRSQRLHASNVCLRQTIRVKLSEHEYLIAVVEETQAGLEDVAGWFKPKGTLRSFTRAKGATMKLNALIEKRDDGVHVLVPQDTFYDLGITTEKTRTPVQCGVPGTDKKLFIEPINADREARV